MAFFDLVIFCNFVKIFFKIQILGIFIYDISIGFKVVIRDTTTSNKSIQKNFIAKAGTHKGPIVGSIFKRVNRLLHQCRQKDLQTE